MSKPLHFSLCCATRQITFRKKVAQGDPMPSTQQEEVKVSGYPMSTAVIFFVSTFLLLSPPLLTSSTAIGDAVHTVYDLLGDYHFPVGLLPKGVIGYDLDHSTGQFRAYLNGSCSFPLEGSYQLKYQSTVSGYISKDRLTNLNGVSVKVLLFWFNIVEVVRNDDEIQLSVGIASASYPLENFFVCPRCGCGLDCDDLLVRKLKLNPRVSSI